MAGGLTPASASSHAYRGTVPAHERPGTTPPGDRPAAEPPPREVPPDRQAAILALIRTQDRLPHSPEIEPLPDLVTGRRLANLGGNKALQLCLESTGDDAPAAPASSGDGLDGWAERFLEECGRLAEAELVLAHCETGFMRMVDDGNGTFDAWIATKRPPTSWRERADIDWWAVVACQAP